MLDTAPEAAEETAAPTKVEQNGIVRPKAGTTTALIWEIADAKSKEAGEPAKRKDIIDAAIAQGLNAATVATQYGRWRVFYGLDKIVKEPKPAKTPKAKKAEAEETPDVVVEDSEPEVAPDEAQVA
jgi:hypothetical protein